MIISLTIWFISFAFLILLFSGKKREMLGRDPYMRIGSLGLDQKIIRYVNICRTSLQAHNRHKVVMYLHGVAEQLEKFGLYMAEKIVLRFSHVRDIAIGKDIQKNKGHIAFKGILKRLID